MATILIASLGHAGQADAGALDPALPDLVPASAQNLHFQQCACLARSQRLILRFDGRVHNAGRGALEIHGQDPRQNADGQVEMSKTFQRVYAGTGTLGSPWADIEPAHPPRMVYESTDGHQHFHVKDVVLTELLGPNGVIDDAPFAKTSAGFCLADSESIDPWASTVAFYSGITSLNCGSSDPQAPEVTMGVSPGWSDVYPWYVPLQWIDVSDVPPGEYSLRAIVDPENVIVETDENNNVDAATDVPAEIPGYLARDVTASVAPNPHGAEIRLPADAYTSTTPGAPAVGPPEFEIVSAPAHGTLDVSEGTWLSGPAVQYTPARGFHGEDSFVYAVRNSSSPGFPVHPSTAQISIRVR